MKKAYGTLLQLSAVVVVLGMSTELGVAAQPSSKSAGKRLTKEEKSPPKSLTPEECQKKCYKLKCINEGSKCDTDCKEGPLNKKDPSKREYCSTGRQLGNAFKKVFGR